MYPIARLREMMRVDAGVAAELAKAAMPYPWSKETFEDCFKANYHAWILELDKAIGFIVLLDQHNVCEILSIAVHPDYQRKGYGQQLLAHAIVYAEAHEFERIDLEVRASSDAAISLYRRVGFEEVGRRKHYYPSDSGREDALLMSREILS